MPLQIDLTKLRFIERLRERGFKNLEKGGVIFGVSSPEQARTAEDAGALAVVVEKKTAAELRLEKAVERMIDPLKIKEIINAVKIPVLACCRIGHAIEAKILETLGIAMIDESEVLTQADPFKFIDKTSFKTPFLCGARNLGEALKRIEEGAVMIRTKGEPGTGNVAEVIRNYYVITTAIRELKDLKPSALEEYANSVGVKFELVRDVAKIQRLPVLTYGFGDIVTPADAAMLIQLGGDGVFVGSDLFKSEKPKDRAKAIVEAVTNYDNPKIIAEVSKGFR